MKINLITTEELAKIIRVKKEVIERWRYQKKFDLPYIKVGGKIRYSVDDVEKWLENNRFN